MKKNKLMNMFYYKIKTPVAFIIFNRPETTKRVFEEIAKARPQKLLVIADGPRVDHLDDVEKCAAVRDIIDGVDWDYEVLKNYSDVNLGCKRRVSSGLDWVFDTFEEAIILEDDCLPHPTFFRFCEELLERYRDDDRVMHIGGNNFLCSRENLKYSYYFSMYSQIWGWATWRRAWKYYDVEMKLWPTIRDNEWMESIFDDKQYANYRKKIWDNTYNGKIDTWDYQWLFAMLIQNGVSILPKMNLISNIGFGKDATHAQKGGKLRAGLQTSGVEFPLRHPLFMVRDAIADGNYKKINMNWKIRLFENLQRIVSKTLFHRLSR